MGPNPVALYSALLQDLAHVVDGESTSAFAARNLTKTLLKKCVESEEPTAHSAAVASFEGRRQLGEPVLPDLDCARAFVYRCLGSKIPEDAELYEGCRVSSGSVVGMREEDSTNGLLKFADQWLTFSSPDVLYQMMSWTRRYDPLLCALLHERLRSMRQVKCTPYSSVFTVPKQREIRRVIALQPLLDAYLQQGVKSAIERRLAKLGLHIKRDGDHVVQAFRNQALARLGSMGHGLSTIDFSNASDSLSDSLLRYLLPPEWYALCMAFSPPAYKVDGEVRPTGRIAMAMGNAITFPLETLVFLAIGYQAQRDSGVTTSINENLAVFGDDVVIDTRSTSRFIELATQSGFTVNPSKSFWEGEFRESCGADWLNGVNVRGVYINSLTDAQSLLSARNLLAAWAYRHDIPLDRTLNCVDALLREAGVPELLVPLSAPLDSGVRAIGALWPVSPGLQCRKCTMLEWYPSKRRRPSSYIFERFPGILIQSALNGWIRSGFLGERPKDSNRSRISFHHFHGGDEALPTEVWLYDTTCRTAGLIWDDNVLS